MGETATSRLDGNPTDKLIDAIPLDTLTNNHNHHHQSPHQVRDTSVRAGEQDAVHPPRDGLKVEGLANGTAASSQTRDGVANGSTVVIDMVGDQERSAKEISARPPNGDLPV